MINESGLNATHQWVFGNIIIIDLFDFLFIFKFPFGFF
jgi:hypothetical protein